MKATAVVAAAIAAKPASATLALLLLCAAAFAPECWRKLAITRRQVPGVAGIMERPTAAFVEVAC